MDAFESRLYIERTRFFYEFGKAEECFQFGGHRVEEGGCQNIHTLHIGEAQLLGRLLSVYKAVKVNVRK
jgi:hypothetical protein